MKILHCREARALLFSILLLVIPAIVNAQTAPPPSAQQTDQAKSGPPPIAPQMVREGDFAIKLQSALGLGTTDDEAEAETRLGEVGITPRNGWIADYPVTPDIIGELQKSVGNAADAGNIEMNKGEALKKLDNVSSDLKLAITFSQEGKASEALPQDAEQYPNPAAINNYYIEGGPPVVTYYAPPPDYYYLYAWVPSPFWWSGFWFPGFFILNDFHRPILVGHRWCFISNHFNDVKAHRVFRIDPVGRFKGKTFAGIGVSNRKGFISTGVAHSERKIFNGPRTRGGPERRAVSQPARGGGKSSAPPAAGGRRPYGRSGGTRMPLTQG